MRTVKAFSALRCPLMPTYARHLYRLEPETFDTCCPLVPLGSQECPVLSARCSLVPNGAALELKNVQYSRYLLPTDVTCTIDTCCPLVPFGAKQSLALWALVSYRCLLEPGTLCMPCYSREWLCQISDLMWYVKEINQINCFTNQDPPCTTINRILKEFSVKWLERDSLISARKGVTSHKY